MLALASNYRLACKQFKSLLRDHIDQQPYPVLDEIIEITKINEDNSMDEKESYIEFTESWLKELEISIDIIDY